MHIRGKKRVTCTQRVRRGLHAHKGSDVRDLMDWGHMHTRGVRRGSLTHTHKG